MWDESAPDAAGGLEVRGSAPDAGRGGRERRPGPLALLIKPKTALTALAARPRPPRSLAAYALCLSTLPPAARAAGLLLFGGRDAAGPFAVTPAAAVLDAALAWAAILIATGGLALALWLILRALRAQVRPGAAAALAVYASTPGWLGGTFRLAPGLELLSVLFVLLGLRVLWIGAGRLLGLPPRPRTFLVALGTLSAVLLQTLLGALLKLAFALL